MIAFLKDGLERLQAEYESHAIDMFGHLRQLREPKRLIHYYYPLDMLREEVYKRTSMIGKYRLTKEGENMLDATALTQDESDTFDFLAEDGAHEVFEKIIAYTDDKLRSFLYNDGAENSVTRAENLGNTFAQTSLTTTASTTSVKWDYQYNLANALNAGEQLRLTFEGVYIVRNFMSVNEQRTFEHTVLVNSAAVGNNTLKDIEFVPELDTTPSGTIGVLPEVFKGVVSVKLKEYAFEYATPAIVPVGTWVDYTTAKGENHVYYAIAESDMNADLNDTSLYLNMDGQDLRYSVHYIVNKPIWVRENSVTKTDRSIFEALVAFIMYRWFLIAQPQEAEPYMLEYEKRLIDVKYNLGFSERMSVISHPF